MPSTNNGTRSSITPSPLPYIDNCAVKTPREPGELEQVSGRIAKSILDLGHMVDLLRKSSRHSVPWQRQLAARLADVDGHLQLLRMTLSLDKTDIEILGAADDLASACRLALLSIAGTRADQMTKAAVHLVDQLAASIATLARRVHAQDQVPRTPVQTIAADGGA
jgi:hypothetical protein